MTEPRRLLEEDATNVERMLLDCAAQERPDPRLEAKMLLGLSAAGLAGGASAAAHGAATTQASAAGITAGAEGTSALVAGEVGVASEATMASSGLWVGIVKWGAGIFLAGALFGVGKAWLDTPGDGGEATRSSPSARAQEQSSVASNADAVVPDEREKASAEDAPATGPSQRGSARNDGSQGKPTSAPTDASEKTTKPLDESGTSALRAEVAALDRVRAALARGKSGEALSLIQRYRRQFPSGALQQESTVLEVRALEAGGHQDQANALRRDFLQEHPDTLHQKQLKTTDEQAR